MSGVVLQVRGCFINVSRICFYYGYHTSKLEESVLETVMLASLTRHHVAVGADLDIMLSPGIATTIPNYLHICDWPTTYYCNNGNVPYLAGNPSQDENNRGVF